MKSKFHHVIVAMVLSATACVPARQFEDLQKKEKACQEEAAKLKNTNTILSTENTDLTARNAKLEEGVNKLANDSAVQGNNYRRLNELYNQLTASYDKLLANNEKLQAGSAEETRKLLNQLNEARTDLQKKEDALRKSSADLDSQQRDLDESKKALAEREAKVAELQAIIAQKDSAATSLKNAVSKALMGFENNGLTIEKRNGKVYVSLEEQLLFASGSTVIEKKGEAALKKLAVVLESDPDLGIVVEGHTDNVPINGTLASGARDNWELSVLRATSVTKILLTNSKIVPTRITPAGKGPYMPLDSAATPEAKRKNRRTEIILTPKLAELMKAMGE
jgi:chemotaxis protein MotB